VRSISARYPAPRSTNSPRRSSPAPYLVTVERQGVAPLQAQLLVRGASKRAAGELASCIAERKRGGTFEATKVRRAARKVSALPASSFDDADL
jgi:hypothetical protein